MIFWKPPLIFSQTGKRHNPARAIFGKEIYNNINKDRFLYTCAHKDTTLYIKTVFLYLACLIIPFLLCLLDYIFLKCFHNRWMVYVLQHRHIEVSLPAWRYKRQNLYIQWLQDRNIGSHTDTKSIGDKACSNLVFVNLIGNIRCLPDTFKQSDRKSVV